LGHRERQVSAPPSHTEILLEKGLIIRQLFGVSNQASDIGALSQSWLATISLRTQDVLLVPVEVDTRGGHEVIS
jgi:hypothetical protein